MKICPHCRSPNHDSYQMCVRCRRLSPAEEQRRRHATMLLPHRETMDFVPAGAHPGETKKAGATLSVPDHATAPPAPADLPDDFFACNAVAMQFYNAGVYDRAEAAFRHCADLNPNDVNTWMLRGVSLRCLRKVDEALTCFDRAIRLRPDNIDAWRRKGFTLRILNRTEDAIKCYDKIVELNPKDTAALNDKANALDDLKRHEDAIKVYEMVLKINPKDRYAQDNKEASERILKRRAADNYRSQFFGPKPI